VDRSAGGSNRDVDRERADVGDPARAHSGARAGAWNFRKSYKKVSELLDRIYGDVNPLMRHASAIADNVNYVTTSIRTERQQ